MTGRTQDTPIAILELRHANRTLFNGHAQQGHLQLDTPVPRHTPPHELDLAHEMRRTRVHTQAQKVRIIVWQGNSGRRWWRWRSWPKEIRNEEERLGRRIRSRRTTRNRRQSENSRHNWTRPTCHDRPDWRPVR